MMMMMMMMMIMIMMTESTPECINIVIQVS